MRRVRRKFARFLILFVALFSISVHAYAHIPCMCNNPPDQCTCFIQLGDKGLAVERIISVLKDKGYLKKSVKKKVFTPEVRQAVIRFQKDNHLECTGRMDDETLDALLFDILPDQSSKYSADFRDGIYYVPTDGGIRFHSDPTCCEMKNPRMISGTNAISLGLEHCKWNSCIQHPALTYSALGLKPRILPDGYYAAEEREANIILQRSLPQDSVGAEYIGNRKSHVFHRASCSSVGKMNEKNKIDFSSRDEAIGKGYKPCGRCNP